MKFYDIFSVCAGEFDFYRKKNKNLYHFSINPSEKITGIVEIIPSKFNLDDHNENTYEIDLGIADYSFSSLLYGGMSINKLRVTNCIISNTLNNLSKTESYFTENNTDKDQLIKIFTDWITPYFIENLNSNYLIEKCLSKKWLIPNLYAAYYYKCQGNLSICNDILLECKPQMNEFWLSKLIVSGLFNKDQLKIFE